MKTAIIAIMLIALTGMTEFAQADTYTWTDASGNVHFSDHPPESKTSKRIAGQPNESIVNKARKLADQWLNVRCDWQAANRIRQQYEELRAEGAIKMHECRSGNANGCKDFGVSFSEAHMEKEAAIMHKYLPNNFGLPVEGRHTQRC